MPAHRRVWRLVAVCLAALLLIYFSAVALMGLIWPEASGEKVISRGSLTVDASHMAQGYIMAKAGTGTKKLKLRIIKDDEIYTYDLNNKGEYEVFPLQMGSGKYTVSLYKNVKSNQYSKDSEVVLNVTLDDENAAFLIPSQYVNYSPDSPAVQASMELCADLTTDLQKMQAVEEYMIHGFAFDYVRSLTKPEAYLGDVDGCFENRLGLCQDLAAVTACMLRAQGIPTQLVIGYVDNYYHAWNNVLIDGEYRRLDITAVLSGQSKNMVYTAERCY